MIKQKTNIIRKFIAQEYLKTFFNVFIHYSTKALIIGLVFGIVFNLLIYLLDKTLNTYVIITIFTVSIFSWLIVTYSEAFNFLKSINKNLQKFKKLPLEEQLKKIEAIEAQKALRKSQKKRGN